MKNINTNKLLVNIGIINFFNKINYTYIMYIYFTTYTLNTVTKL